jgi:hypothetical protein
MHVRRMSIFDARADRVADLASDPTHMRALLRPLVVAAPIDPPAFPRRWAPGRYRVDMKLFGFIPLGWQDIMVTAIGIDPLTGRWHMHDAGCGLLARRWDHEIEVEALDDGRTRYTDRVEVEAGVTTIAAWLFAQAVFAWRHYRWRVLLRDRAPR